MAYATVQDMIDRFGQGEMARASTPENTPVVGVVPEPIQIALDDASAMIDSFVRKRYGVPLQAVPPEINRACCMLARADLGLGNERSISEQAAKAREETIAWLKAIARGEVVLGMDEVTVGDESFATASSRRPVFGDPCDDGQLGGFGFWNGGEP